MGKKMLFLLSVTIIIMPLQAQSDYLDRRFDDQNRRIADLKSELKGDISDLKSELKGDISDLKSELKGDITDLKDFIKEGFSSINRRFDDQNKRFDDQNNRIDDLIWLVGLILGLLGSVFVGVLVALLTQYFARRQEEKRRRNAYRKQKGAAELSAKGQSPYPVPPWQATDQATDTERATKEG